MSLGVGVGVTSAGVAVLFVLFEDTCIVPFSVVGKFSVPLTAFDELSVSFAVVDEFRVLFSVVDELSG